MTAPRSRPTLVLWDVDHTLVRVGSGISREIYARAFEQVTGKPLGELAEMAGRTERAIIAETLRLNGVAGPETLSAAFYAEFYAALGAATEGLSDLMREVGVALPGAAEAIARLARSGAVQSLVTGNVRPIAVTKLRVFGLGDGIDFSCGGYGDDGSDRADLVRLARERADARHGVAFPAARTFVIGDTPHDIQGARDAGAVAVGVAPGRSSAEELAEAGADLVLTSLGEPALLYAAVDGEG